MGSAFQINLHEQDLRFSLGRGSIIDLNGGRHAGRENDILRDLIDVDAHRNALSETYPGEDRIDTRESLLIRLSVRNVDAASDTVDVPSNDFSVAHELDAGQVASANVLELGFFELAIDPGRIRIHNGDC